ncbi:MAG: hypothetical protein ACI7YS_12165 [Flavobacterium sp.]
MNNCYSAKSGDICGAQFSIELFAELGKEGVPLNSDGTPGNPDLSTDHFIVIVGMGSNSNGKYFQFYDNASSISNQGTNSLNLLYYNSTTGKISGVTQCSGYRDSDTTHNYIITQIRKSKKK